MDKFSALNQLLVERRSNLVSLHLPKMRSRKAIVYNYIKTSIQLFHANLELELKWKRKVFFKNGPTPASFSFILIFSNTHYNSYNN